MLLENSLSEKLLRRGKELLANNAILEVNNPATHLWSSIIKDDKLYEVEISNPFLKNQTTSCECEHFKKDANCEHVVATLLHLQKQYEAKEIQSKKKAAEKSKPFTIKTVLEDISQDDIYAFIKGYAQRDKVFHTMFKTSFARKLDRVQESEKYNDVIKRLIKPMTTDKLKSTPADLRLAVKVSSEYLSQLEDAVSLGQYQEAYSITSAILPKLHYMAANYKSNRATAIKLINSYHKSIEDLYRLSAAPQLKASIDEMVVDIYSRSYYLELDEILSLFFIGEKYRPSDVVEQLIEVVRKKAKKEVNDLSIVRSAAQIYSGATVASPVSDDMQIKACNYLLQNGYEIRAIAHLESMYNKEGRNKKVEFALINAYQETNNKKAIVDLSIELFVKHHDMKFYKMLKDEVTIEEWPAISDTVLHKMNSNGAPASLIASYFYNENDHPNLLKILKSENDLRLIMKYDYYLYKSQFPGLEKVYHHALDQYMSQYGGHMATAFVNEIMAHLNSIRAYKMVSSIRNFIMKKYPHRSSVISSLN